MRQEDIPALCALARRIWRAHYPGIITEAQIEYMLDRYYGEEFITEQFEQGEPVHILAWKDESLLGFISLRRNGFIDKFYVDDAARSKGTGTALLSHVAGLAPEGGCLRLRVNRNNRGSVEYYKKRGFAIETELDLPFGPYTLNDYEMVKQVESVKASRP